MEQLTKINDRKIKQEAASTWTWIVGLGSKLTCALYSWKHRRWKKEPTTNKEQMVNIKEKAVQKKKEQQIKEDQRVLKSFV